MNLSILQKIIAASLCGGLTLITVVVSLTTGGNDSSVENKNATSENKNATVDNNNSQRTESNDVYFYVRGHNKTPNKKPKDSEINHQNKNFLCKYDSKYFDCEISTVKTNQKKWHNARNIELLENKPHVSDLKNEKNIFRIKFKQELWAKIVNKKDYWIDIVSKEQRTQEYAYLQTLFVTYKNEQRINFNHFVAKLVEINGSVNLSEKGFKCKFDNKGSADQGVNCKMKTFDNEDKILNSKNYEESIVFNSNEATTLQKDKLYLIDFRHGQTIINKAKEIYYFKGNDKTKSLKFEIVSQNLFFDKDISDHIFIFK